MRILYWTPLFWPEIGGIEAIAMNVLPALRARGHDVMGVASHGPLELPDRSEYDGIPVYRYHMFNALWKKDPKLLMGITKKIANLKRSFQPDIVHMLFGPPALAYFHFQTMKAHPSPTLLTVHADLTNASTGPDTLLWRMLQNADWITSDAEITLSHVRKIYPQIGERFNFHLLVFRLKQFTVNIVSSPWTRAADQKGAFTVQFLKIWAVIVCHNKIALLYIFGNTGF